MGLQIIFRNQIMMIIFQKLLKIGEKPFFLNRGKTAKRERENRSDHVSKEARLKIFLNNSLFFLKKYFHNVIFKKKKLAFTISKQVV